MIRALLILVMAFACTPGWGQNRVGPDDMRLELVLEDRSHPPFAEEMILLRITGAYRLPITLESLIQPDLDGFNWMQLGEDIWFRERDGGLDTLKFERRMALFPHQPGTFTIGPFTHKLSLLSRSGQRFDHRLVSDTVSLTVGTPPEHDGWWFPTRKLEVSDRWSNAPEALVEGGSALRVVALTVEGTEPARIPPMPDLTAAGAFVFPHPEQRIVELGPRGPVTRVFWRWTIRPARASAGYLNPIEIPYFDTETQESKSITLAAQRVAYAGVDGAGPTAFGAALPASPAADDVQPDAPTAWRMPSLPLSAIVLAGLLLGLAPLGVLLRRGHWSWPPAIRRLLTRNPDQTALRRAAKQNDPMAVWHHANRLIARTGGPAPASLSQLGAALFSPSPPDMPDLREITKTCNRMFHPDG